MSELIKHECGICMIRLLKPLDYYRGKYGTPFYALQKLYLLMEKQRNRGHDGAGVAGIKFDMHPGQKYISIEKSNSQDPTADIFRKINSEIFELLENVDAPKIQWLKENARFCGELLLGHLRYGTFGKNRLDDCHPFLRENNWISRNLVLAGNFNLTNVDELFKVLVEIGQHPKNKSDTITILEKIGHFLDEENHRLYRKYLKSGVSKDSISQKIIDNIDVLNILRESCKKWDGGYVIGGIIGHGDAFLIRDPNGIRPAFYYHDDEIFIAASERPAIQTALNVSYESIKEVPPAHAIILKKNGDFICDEYMKAQERKACSFERIYFSRGADAEIYQERKNLGRYLVPDIIESINHDMENAVFSFIPNTAETCFLGMIEGLHDYCVEIQKKMLLNSEEKLSSERIDKIMRIFPRLEKIAVKDVKLRTFITQDSHRNSLVAHVYDTTYGTVRKNTDTLVAVDDSIVRGTTLKESILKILDRLSPKKILLVSSAPQIRYPDCYGIDMAKLEDFAAFQAAIHLLRQNEMDELIENVYEDCFRQLGKPVNKIENAVKKIYEPFSAQQISAKISEILTPPNLHAEVEILYQNIENLHRACPNNTGDWYFTGNYPTPGGVKVVNKSFINFMEGKNERAY